jgi:uncharacterized protein (DUF3084 family)
MTNNKAKKLTDLTPATLENMPIGQKISAYEQILSDQAHYTEKLAEIEKRGNEVLEPAGKTFTHYLQRSDVIVPKKRDVDPTIAAFAQRVGGTVSTLLANGSTIETTLEEYLGKESYAKLKVIADEYSIQGDGIKHVDKKESDKVWQEYTKVRKEYQEVQEKLAKANRRMEQADQYVSYVQKLAEVASKTKRLMQ